MDHLDKPGIQEKWQVVIKFVPCFYMGYGEVNWMPSSIVQNSLIVRQQCIVRVPVHNE